MAPVQTRGEEIQDFSLKMWLLFEAINRFKFFKVTKTTFYEISKMSYICSIFRKNVCIVAIHIFWDCASFVFHLFPRERRSKPQKFMADIHKVFFQIFCLFFASGELLKKYSPLTLKRCNNWTTKYDAYVFSGLNRKTCNIQNYDIFLNTFVHNLI